ncbi:MAG: hypothetical protein J2P17_14980 [Mycobacterium sp.]|nr:hypothetical protein [Mycobacterium sp.]
METKNYAEMKIMTLRRLAQGRVKNATQMRKADLITALQEADAKEARAAQKTKTAPARTPDAKTARRNGKAPADAQAATDPGMAKAERFVADARAAGWTGKVTTEKDGAVAVATVKKSGATITCYWLDGVWQRWDPCVSAYTPKDGKPRKILNASAARKLLAS